MTSNALVKFSVLLLSLAIILIDQWTKQVAGISLEFGQSVSVLPFFDLQLSYNKGAAFGILGSAGGWQRILFAVIAAATIIAILIWIIRKPKEQLIHSLGLAMILGGAAGNLIDRLTLGHVIDFILLHWNGYGFPNFNIADIAINLGVLLVVLSSIRKSN